MLVKEEFYSKLTKSHVFDENYNYATIVLENFGCHTPKSILIYI